MREVRTVAVIGAGEAGRHLAMRAALGGYRTILEDVVPGALRRAESLLIEQFKNAVAAGELSQAAANEARARIAFANSIEDAARQADLVIEAVPDEMESKMEIFTLLDRMCRPGTVMVSSTRALRVTDVTDVTSRAGDCVGMRFADGRLEIVRGKATKDATWTAAQAVGSRMARETTNLQE